MPERIQRKRTKGWRMPEGAVYVGRPSVFGNPFLLSDGYSRNVAVGLFREWAHKVTLDPAFWSTSKIVAHVYLLAALPKLRGKDLVCWCALDAACHADVLLEIANAAPSVPETGAP